MPEGPELESARRLVAGNCLNSPISLAIVADDEKVFMGRTPDEVRAALEGRSITAARRKAKYLWFELDGDGPMPLFHFGMTGSIVVKGVAAAQYVNAAPADESVWPPRFCKLELHLANGTELAFCDARRFGRVQLLDDPRQQEPISKLGFDVIDELPDEPEFQARLKAYQKPGGMLRIKALLLDQGFTAGVGNWVADEVLYQARIHPEQPVADMTDFQVNALHAAIKHVMQVAVDVDADSAQFPVDWLFHYRWTGKKASSVGGHKVDFVTVGSRTSAFVPALQKVISGTGLSKAKPEPKRRAGGKRKRKAEQEDEDDEGEGGGAGTQTDSALQGLPGDGSDSSPNKAPEKTTKPKVEASDTEPLGTPAKRSTRRPAAVQAAAGREPAPAEDDDDSPPVAAAGGRRGRGGKGGKKRS